MITPFPGMLKGYLQESMMKRATAVELVDFGVINLRDFAIDKHRSTDDRPFGGGAGMIMKPEPIFAAVESIRTLHSHVILMTPLGVPFKQTDAQRLADQKNHLIFICGHYEGIDERVRQALANEEISIGDYVLTNGVLPAMTVIDAIVRLKPGVLGGGSRAVCDESFSSGLLEYPQYTRPSEFRGMKVPAILSSGNHGKIAAWRREQALKCTAEYRSDLLPDRP